MSEMPQKAPLPLRCSAEPSGTKPPVLAPKNAVSFAAIVNVPETVHGVPSMVIVVASGL